ncbi:F0F1 ATP synthase subunit delta [Jatrophihabitans telluris]|uniref:ATP synthase subunit delta n=1 Tax=Jatrophihabitans telluris TaxID=2038343 RepID=A0ABY4R457_9ACTN|nr:F0F1 ATP synthase subunit delta [Jatrophihabitans telluris]UQX89866.1 F0F1 ATP synthase subunit delta [Jatrophihabitans telluris]
MIHAASRLALVESRERLNGVLSGLGTDGTGPSTLASELYGTADLLVGQPRLRRTLADPSTDATNRGNLLRSLLAGRLSGPTLEVAGAVVEQRWSSAWDLADALEILADEALLASAEQQGTLDTVEDELFRFERILDGAPELTAALDEQGAPPARRIELLRSVLGSKVQPITLELLEHAVTSARKRSIALAIDDLLEASAARRQRSVARVISATELTEAQTGRLTAVLSELYGRPISVRSAIDPGIRGGLVVRVGDEVIDGTIASRLAAAKIALSH